MGGSEADLLIDSGWYGGTKPDWGNSKYLHGLKMMISEFVPQESDPPHSLAFLELENVNFSTIGLCRNCFGPSAWSDFVLLLPQ